MTSVFRCPICLNNASVKDRNFLQRTDYNYDLSSLKNHLMLHSIGHFIEYVIDDVEDPDLNYKREKEDKS